MVSGQGPGVLVGIVRNVQRSLGFPLIGASFLQLKSLSRVLF